MTASAPEQDPRVGAVGRAEEPNPSGVGTAALFAGAGEVRALARTLDWGATPLGWPETWPPALRIAARAMLDAAHPICLWAGPTYALVYNDAYRRLLGAKHPAALGQPGAVVWAEIWEEAAPQIAQVAAGGPTVTGDDVRFAVARREGGATEDAWFSYSLSALRAEDGSIVALLSIAPETTARVRTEGALQTERARLSEIVRIAPAFMAALRGPEHVITLTNAGYDALVGHRAVLGRTVAEALPEAAAQGFVALLDRVLATGAPFVGREVPYRRPDAAGAEDVRYVDFVYQALTEADGTRSGVLVHGVDVTAQVLARREVERLLADAESARATAERLLALSAALTSALTPDAVAALTADAVREAVGADAAGVGTVSADGQVLEYGAMRGFPDAWNRAYDRMPLDAGTPLADAVRTGTPVYLESHADWEAHYPALAAEHRRGGFEAAAALPCATGPRVVGGLALSVRGPRAFTPDERTLLLAFAQQGAAAFVRATAYAEAEAARRAAEQARAAADAANQAKSQFLAVMSHELRTPLNAIGGYAELMEMGIRGPVTAEQREDLSRIQRSQRHLLGLVNEVLNYAKLETGAVHYELTTVPAHDALAGAEALVAPQASAKGLTVVLTECPAELAVRADPEKLRQILVNLASNAVKFTDRGGRIVLACAPAAAASDAPDAAQVAFTVRDTGIGVPADKLDAIFDPFVQVRGDLTRPHEGTGLGLAISRDLARGMGGDLRAESTVGVGSVFTLSLRGGSTPGP